MQIALKIDDQQPIPKGVKVVQVVEMKSGVLAGLGEDGKVYALHGTDWCLFSMSFVPEATDGVEAPAAPADEAQTEVAPEAAPSEAEAA